jgi:hypothetical protein
MNLFSVLVFEAQDDCDSIRVLVSCCASVELPGQALSNKVYSVICDYRIFCPCRTQLEAFLFRTFCKSSRFGFGLLKIRSYPDLNASWFLPFSGPFPLLILLLDVVVESGFQSMILAVYKGTGTFLRAYKPGT